MSRIFDVCQICARGDLCCFIMGCGASSTTLQAVNTQQNVDQTMLIHNGVKQTEKVIQQPQTTYTNGTQQAKKACKQQLDHIPAVTAVTTNAPKYTEESLKDFLHLQNKIQEMQQSAMITQYQQQHQTLVALYKSLQEKEKHVQNLKQQTAKEYKDVKYMQHPSVRAMFKTAHQLQFQIDKEQREYMEALNRQEVAEKELSCAQAEYNAMYAEVGELRKEYEKLEVLQKEEEQRLEEIFGSTYGSDLEEQLEEQTTLLQQRKDLIQTTHAKWNNAKVLMLHASNQLGFTTRRWAQIKTVADNMVQARYSMVTECRNHLIAASQNITNTHRNLGNVKEPYCTPEDLEILNSSIRTIFQDVMSHDCFTRALQTYHCLHVRAYNLQQWITLVLQKTINKDLSQIVPEYQRKVTELRQERLRLINLKIRELQGEEVKEEDLSQKSTIIDRNANQTTSKADVIVPTPTPDIPSDTHIAQPDPVPAVHGDDAARDDGSDQPDDSNKQPPPPLPDKDNYGDPQSMVDEVKSLTSKEPSQNGSSGEKDTITAEQKDHDKQVISKSVEKPKPLSELAPLPNMETLFGNIEELKTKYEQHLTQFAKAQNLNKTRVDEALQEKLKARRSRRVKLEINDVDITELAHGLTTLVK